MSKRRSVLKLSFNLLVSGVLLALATSALAGPTVTPTPTPSATPTATPTATPSATPAGSNCCFVHTATGCEDPTCEATICELDPICCDVEWDFICVNEANVFCPVCGFASPTPTATPTATPSFTPIATPTATPTPTNDRCMNAELCEPISCPAQNSCSSDSDCLSGATCVPYGTEPFPACASGSCFCNEGIWICTGDCSPQCIAPPDADCLCEVTSINPNQVVLQKVGTGGKGSDRIRKMIMTFHAVDAPGATCDPGEFSAPTPINLKMEDDSGNSFINNATTKVESSPPLKNAPTGTSDTRWSRIASTKCCSSSSRSSWVSPLSFGS